MRDDCTAIDDAVLPAAAYLAGAAAADVVGAAVAAGGGTLLSIRPNHVQYRPQSDLVVRYQARVSWSGGPVTDETLVAATTLGGPPPGTVPVEAEMDDGTPLIAGVWRWPFDPTLAGLAAMVTPHLAERALADVIAGPLRLEVVAYRPCERAVVRVTGSDDRRLYVKVVAPHFVPALADRHRLLAAAGVPVPEVLAADAAGGWIAMSALGGDTLRDRFKAGTRPWPAAGRFRELTDRLADVHLAEASPVRPRIVDAPGHAAMLATIMPAQRARLDELAARFGDAAPRAVARVGATIHGDLHEAQLVLAGDEIRGVLDIDDAGPGDPVDDMANLLGHLVYRATTSGGPAIGAYAEALRHDIAADVDGTDLDEATAAVIVGLATGPYRIQQTGWHDVVLGQIEIAEALLDGAFPTQHGTMREVSASAHRLHTTGCAA